MFFNSLSFWLLQGYVKPMEKNANALPTVLILPSMKQAERTHE